MLAGVTIGKLLWQSGPDHAQQRWGLEAGQEKYQKPSLKQETYADEKTMLKVAEISNSSHSDSLTFFS
jgi:hypothetical protein